MSVGRRRSSELARYTASIQFPHSDNNTDEVEQLNDKELKPGAKEARLSSKKKVFHQCDMSTANCVNSMFLASAVTMC